MDAHTVMEEWDGSPFSGGFDELGSLRARGFSGAVEADDTWLFVRDGDPLAVVESPTEEPSEGDADVFDDTPGTVYEAPTPTAASLAAMLALDGDVRGRYFTDDTSLSMVHETLSSGGFTGYVELSENVLSGDYYVVYDDGDAEYVAYIGPSRQRSTGEEAQRKAESEVGIYSVVAVQFPDVDVPIPEPSTPTETGYGVTPSGSMTDDEATAVDDSVHEATESDHETVESDHEATEAHPEDTRTDQVASDSDGIAATEPVSTTDDDPMLDDADSNITDDGRMVDEDSTLADSDGVEDADSDAGDSETAADDSDSAASEPTMGPGATRLDEDTDGTVDSEREPVEASESTAESDSVAEDEPIAGEDVEVDSSVADGSMTVGVDDGGENADAAEEFDTESSERRSVSEEPLGNDDPTDAAATDSTTESPGTVTKVDDSVGARAKDGDGERAALRTELESLRKERDELERQLSELRAAGSDDTAVGTMSAQKALSETSLFVRESTRGGATLEDAYQGTADRQSVAENLRLEYHTRFESDGVVVDSKPYGDFLQGSLPYRFIEWLVTDVLFEIRSTAAESGMRYLYDAIPDIDRVGFEESVTLDNGTEGREVTFDVVARNRMGEPLVVANLDISRDPTGSERLEPLIADASDVAERRESLAAAFAITSSFFDPDALSVAREATSGSLLSRDKRRSYVKLTRKNGFHLCLVESRDETFYLTVPEL